MLKFDANVRSMVMHKAIQTVLIMVSYTSMYLKKPGYHLHIKERSKTLYLWNDYG